MTDSAVDREGNDGPSSQVFSGLPDVYVSKGAHIAHFFQGDQERLNVLVPWMQAGLLAGDQCVLLAEATMSPVILDHLNRLGVYVEATQASGQLMVSGGGASVSEMSTMFESIISGASRAGREVIRIGGDMTWALGKLPTSEKLMEWEAFYDRFVASRASFVALCQYDHNRFDGSTIMSALQTHPLSIIGSIVQENPFYRDPDEVLQELSQRRV